MTPCFVFNVARCLCDWVEVNARQPKTGGDDESHLGSRDDDDSTSHQQDVSRTPVPSYPRSGSGRRPAVRTRKAQTKP